MVLILSRMGHQNGKSHKRPFKHLHGLMVSFTTVHFTKNLVNVPHCSAGGGAISCPYLKSQSEHIDGQKCTVMHTPNSLLQLRPTLVGAGQWLLRRMSVACLHGPVGRSQQASASSKMPSSSRGSSSKALSDGSFLGRVLRFAIAAVVGKPSLKGTGTWLSMSRLARSLSSSQLFPCRSALF